MKTAIITQSKKLDYEVATVLNIINMCQTFNTLPQAGGLLDQDALLIYLFNVVEEARAVRAELDSKKANRS